MKTSAAFKILLRAVGVVGFIIGAYFAFIAGVPMSHKYSDHPHLGSLIFALLLAGVSLFLVCGAHYVVVFIERKK